MDEIILERPEDLDQHFCADRGYDYPSVRHHNFKRVHPSLKKRGEVIQPKKNNPGGKARRWVVEVSPSWFNRFRKILVRFEKRADTYLALLHMAAAIIAHRKAGFIYG